MGDIFREATGFSACGAAIGEAMKAFSDRSYDFDKLRTFAGEVASDLYAVEALKRCEGPLCQGIVDYDMDGETFKRQLIRSVGSCATAIMQGCAARYEDWRNAPQRLKERCDKNENWIADNTETIQAVESHLRRVHGSLSYKIATVLRL